MKIFINKRCGGYSGGLLVVAADTAEQATAAVLADKKYKYLIDDFGEVPVLDDSCYREANWQELCGVYAHYAEPTVLAEDGYTE